MSDRSPRPPKTVEELERDVIEYSIKVVQSQFSVEEAFHKQDWLRAVRALLKARRDKKVEGGDAK